MKIWYFIFLFLPTVNLDTFLRTINDRCPMTASPMHSVHRLLLAGLFIVNTAGAQEYPRWFLYPGETGCRSAVTVIAPAPTYYRDSAVAFAFRMGCDLAARYDALHIVGGQAFWMTEAGAHSMGASFEQRYDTALTERNLSVMKVIATDIDRNRTLVLAGEEGCTVDSLSGARVSVARIRQPKWVEEGMRDGRYHYGVGFSQEFFYDASSWQTAEKNAVMALARSVRTSVKSMQKRDALEAQDVQDEQIDVTLRNITIVARWKDVKKKVYYVLARAEQ